MNRRRRPTLFLLVAGVVLLVAAGLALRLARPTDPRAREIERIRTRLLDLAATARFTEKDGLVSKLSYANRLAAFFSDPLELDIQVGPRSRVGSMTREQLREGLAGIRAANRGLDLEFIDLVVDLPSNPSAPDSVGHRAQVHLTSKIFFKGEPDYWIQEFRLQLARSNSTWFVQHFQTVETMEK